MIWHTFVIIVSFWSLAQCHSWIACTDYIEKNGARYSSEKCRGWPRGSNLKMPKTTPFGEDAGFDKKPSDSDPCQLKRNDAHYDSQHPMAVYYLGQQVVLAHPMKNHGADIGCTNVYIPDNGNFIYRGPRNGVEDPAFTDFRQNLVFDLGISPTGDQNQQSSTYPKPGFQNAPAFCDDTDKSLGTYSFNVPSDLTPGKYTFIWIWAFNSAADLYSTCFEVEIASDRKERDAKLRDNGFNDLTEPCGGDTSNTNFKGNCNDAEDPLTTAFAKLTTTPSGGSGRITFNFYAMVAAVLSYLAYVA